MSKHDLSDESADEVLAQLTSRDPSEFKYDGEIPEPDDLEWVAVDDEE